MPNEATEKLREMAVHRGFKLVASRRRKPGGDFGKYGLNDAKGEPVFGVGADGLTASAEAIEEYLRGATSNAWSKSAGSTTPRPKPKAEPKAKAASKPRPKPRFKVKVENLLTRLPAAKRAEAFTELLARPGVRVERIVSRGQATPEDAPMVQAQDEWVLLLEGAAGLRIEDSNEVALHAGDHVWIAAGQKHWVTWTAKDRPTVWLAVHLD
ncbi:cupin domain-containing protein [Sphingomonas sp. DG1-23]|uniref:cupin domain-containing protein n=1 Tax=Sphingomonas sp. DG1-23 TaxID=3068316 RepID=UPI0027402AB3|nr:cupin domain-containing protein [Sphingomonas sp. DG1-23]MDP5281307.1 cupin domain-containing protein [Sphingomonas sp. DG1-23]